MTTNSPRTEESEAPWRDVRLPVQQLGFRLTVGRLVGRVFLDRDVVEVFLRARHADVQRTGSGKVNEEITRGYRFYGRGSHCCVTGKARFEARVSDEAAEK